MGDVWDMGKSRETNGKIWENVINYTLNGKHGETMGKCIGNSWENKCCNCNCSGSVVVVAVVVVAEYVCIYLSIYPSIC